MIFLQILFRRTEDSENEYFAKIYSLLYNKMADYEEDKSELMQENISFIECTYIVRKPSKEEKNYILTGGLDSTGSGTSFWSAGHFSASW